MRWFVEVASSGQLQAPEQWVVEAEQWQPALQAARALRGDTPQMNGFSIELLEDGYRAIDPSTMTRYLIRRAPDRTPVTRPGASPARGEPTRVSAVPATTNAATASAAPATASAAPAPTKAASPLSAPATTSASPIATGATPGSKADRIAALLDIAGGAAPRPSASPSKLAAPAPAAVAPHPEIAAAAPSILSPLAVLSAPVATQAVPRPNDVPGEVRSGPPRPATDASAARALPPAPTGASAAGVSSPSVPPGAPAPAVSPLASSTAPQASLPSAPPAGALLHSAAPLPPLPPAELIFERAEHPTPDSPLTYRESAWLVPEGTSIDAAVRLLNGTFEGVRAALAGVRPGKLVKMAVFDHRFESKPLRPPLAALTWKDWRDHGQGPDIRRLGEPPHSMRPSFPPAQPSGMPSSAPAASIVMPAIPGAPPVPSAVGIAALLGAARPVDASPTSGGASNAPPPPAPARVPLAAIPAPAPVAAPPAAPAPVAPPAPVGVVMPVAPPAPVGVPMPVAPAPALTLSTQAAAVPGGFPAPAPVNALAPAVAPHASSQVAASPPSAEAPPAATVNADAPPASMTPQPPASAPALSAAPASVPRTATPRPSSRPSIPGKRLSGDELIADLFEVMHDLHFLRHPLEGADFVLALIMEKIPSTVGLVHFYDIDAREFVIVRAVGPGASKLLQIRTSEKEPLIAEAMRKRRAVVLRDSATERARHGRWALLDIETTSVVCAPVAQGGRYLGALEIANPRDGKPFSDGDGHALTYMGEQFSEFLGSRGVVLDSERASSRSR